MLRTILYLSFATYFAAVGVLSAVWPEKLHAFFIRQYMSVLGGLKDLIGPDTLERLFPRTSIFRFLGLASLATAVVIIYLFFRA